MKKNIFVLMCVVFVGFLLTCTVSGCNKIKEAIEEKKDEAAALTEKVESNAKDLIHEGKDEIKKGADKITK